MPSYWNEAIRAAYRQFGRRHYGVIVYGRLAVKVVPFLLGAAALVGLGLGVRWVFAHVPMGTVGWLCALAFVVVGGTWGTWEYLSLAAARRGLTAARLSLAGSTLAFGFAAVYALALR